MPRKRVQRGQTTVTAGGLAELPLELMEKVLLEVLRGADQEEDEPQEGGLGFSKATAVVRLVCSGWQALYDALVTRLLLRKEITDKAVGMLVRRFPAVSSLDLSNNHNITNVAVLAVSSMPALTSLNLHYCMKVKNGAVLALSDMPQLKTLDLSWCRELTDDAFTAVSRMPALTSLNLGGCWCMEEGLRAVSEMTALVSLDLSRFWCNDVALAALSGMTALTSRILASCESLTDKSMHTVSGLTSLTSLDLSHDWCFNFNFTDAGVLTLSSLPALTHLDLSGSNKVTAAGVEAFRNATAAPNLYVEEWMDDYLLYRNCRGTGGHAMVYAMIMHINRTGLRNH